MVLFGGLFIALQLDATQDTIVQKVVNSFNKSHASRLVVGDLGGTLPFNAVLKDVYLIADIDSARTDTVLAIERVEVGIDLLQLFQKELVINHLSVVEPSVHLRAAVPGTYTLSKALQSKVPADTTDSSDGFFSGFIQDISIMAPSVTIREGALYIEKFFGESKNLNLPEPFSVQSLNTDMYLELTDERRFLDIENFSAMINGYRSRKVTLAGQIYNDDEVLEFNAFNLKVGRSGLQLNGKIEGINLYAGHIVEQFKKAGYNIAVGSDRLDLALFTKIAPQLPAIEEPLEFAVKVDGALNDLQLQTFKLGIDDSYLSITGNVEDLLSKAELHYSFQIDTLEIHRDDIEKLLDQANNAVFHSLENLKMAGSAKGTSDTLSLNIEAISPLGRFTFMGSTQLIEPYHFLGRLSGNNVDLAPFISSIDTTALNFNAGIEGKNPSLTEGRLYFEGDISNSLFGHIPIDSLRLRATLNNGLLDASYFYTQQNELIEGTIAANFTKPQTTLTLKGRTERLDLATLFEKAPIDTTSINTSYFVNIAGLKPDNISGSARFQVKPSIIGGDSVATHQIEVNLSPVTGDARTLSVNSSLLDLQITGDIQPTAIADLYTYWSNYFDRHITKEVLLDSVQAAPNEQFTSLQPIQLKGEIDIKNIDIVKNYLPSFPSITTDGQLKFETIASAERFEFTTQILADTLVINQIKLKNADVNIQGQFQHNKLLKQFSRLELEANAKRFQSNLFDMDSLRMRLRFNQDSLFLTQHVKQFSDTSSYDLELHSIFTDSTVTTVIDNFYLGNYQYAWTENKTPKVMYARSGEIAFNSFRFDNEETYLVLDGQLSPSPDDSLQVRLRDINLGRISSLLREGFNFDGHLDATLTAFSLEEKPSVQGEINVDSLAIQNHFVGKLKVTSNYDRQMDRLAARLVVESDTTTLSDSSSTPNIIVEGYYDPDAFKARRDSAFYFKADFNALDTWFLSLILDDIFMKIEGAATGAGTIAGNGQDLNYHAEFQLQDIFVKPAFVETNWNLNGNVRLDSENGVIINYVDITDENGGTGVLYGKVNLNYDPGTYLDLHLRLNKLKALSSKFELDMPFYGSTSASGTINLVGSTDELRLYSTEDLIITQSSKLGIPLITSTQVADAGEFIEFVESFENPEQALRGDDGKKQNKPKELGPLEDKVEQLSFSNRVNLDLQFRAPQPISVTLLFDPSTGEKLSAEGTGNIRIIMQGGDVQMFGRFNITGGVYHFVSGQLFQRELEIRPGGSIVWTGDPDKARLNNIEAVYHARPDMASLQTGGSDEGFSRSVPVDLVIEITGTINSIKQNYYFELPTFAAAPPRLQFRINRINSNEQFKLLQAASILLSGEFLPVSEGSEAQAFGNQLAQSSTIVNPIISNQIVSPFLSDQINALLNSEVAEVDIDFELNAYNEIDLGIALRLYNDRLILQREGRLTGGSDSDDFIERLGNLSIVYRITPNLSIRAFHRQIPTLGTFSPTQPTDFQPSANGIGLEAQVRYNTWQQLWHNIKELLGFAEEENEEKTPQPSVNKSKTKTEKKEL